VNPSQSERALANPLVARLESAASDLIADPAVNVEDNSLLHYFGYDDGDLLKAEGRARILWAAAKLDRLFILPVPDAPGLVFFGGEADPGILGDFHQGLPRASLAGSGLSPQRAFEACVGEGIEYLSQFLQPGDRLESGCLSDHGSADAGPRQFISAILASSGIDPQRSIAWVPSRRLSNGLEFSFPLDLCYRRRPDRQDFKPPHKLSTGCAAGITIEAATLRALLELIERDAAALWWRGGRRGAAIAPDSEAGIAGHQLLTLVRQGRAQRRTWFIDITTDLAVPAVAALSANADGYGFCFGLAARLTLAEAVRAATFELCQVELGQHVVAAKREESGDGSLNESDLRQLRRGQYFDANRCGLLQPVLGSNPTLTRFPEDPNSALSQLVDQLEARGIATYAIDLTRRHFETPAARVLAPGLQLEPSAIVGSRLARVIRETGGGAPHNGGIPLL
jgi:ribosomal protein S12 methylthiotransferase accessory factor